MEKTGSMFDNKGGSLRADYKRWDHQGLGQGKDLESCISGVFRHVWPSHAPVTSNCYSLHSNIQTGAETERYGARVERKDHGDCFLWQSCFLSPIAQQN